MVSAMVAASSRAARSWSKYATAIFEPRRTRLPLAPATLRAGGWISAGMISTVQMPLPDFAAMAASDWPSRRSASVVRWLCGYF